MRTCLLSGSKVHPWGVFQLMNSTYRCSAYPESTSDALQQKSWVDLHLLAKSFNFYVVAIDMKFSKNLYSETSPKFPLSVCISLDYVGKSSRRSTHRLCHNDVEKDYVSVICTEVLVSPETKKPVPYPNWWIEKYAPLCENDKLVSFALPKDRLQNPCKTSTTVDKSDTDYYNHTNTGSYIKFFCESIFRNISKNAYKNICQNHFDSGVKSINLTLAGSALLHDELDIITWEDSIDENIAYGEIVVKEGNTCCDMKIEFYNDNTTHSAQL